MKKPLTKTMKIVICVALVFVFGYATYLKFRIGSLDKYTPEPSQKSNVVYEFDNYGEDCIGIWREPDGDYVFSLDLIEETEPGKTYTPMHVYLEDGVNIYEGDYNCTIVPEIAYPYWQIEELNIKFYLSESGNLALETENGIFYLQPNQ